MAIYAYYFIAKVTISLLHWCKYTVRRKDNKNIVLSAKVQIPNPAKILSFHGDTDHLYFHSKQPE